MNYLNIFNSCFLLLIILSIGLVLKKLDIVKDDFSKSLANLIFTILYPAAILDSMMYPFSPKILIESGILLIISISVIGVSLLVAIIVSPILTKEKNSNVVYKFNIIFSNFVLMAFPLTKTMYGDKGLFYISIFILPLQILYNSLGVLLMLKGSFTKIKLKVKDIINPPIICVLSGIVIFVFSIPVPEIVKITIGVFSDSYVPMGMLLGGIVIGERKMKGIFTNYKVYIYSFIRLIIIPIMVFIILRQFNLDIMLLTIPVIVAGMPAPATSVVVSEKYNRNSYLSAQCVLISTIFSICTIPLIIYIINIFT